MQRELIILLLGIVCISTLSSLLSGYVQIETNKVLLDTVAGYVGAGNFSYWQLGHTGPLLVELTSLAGDADLYVSDNIRPSYEIDRYNFSSATCGPDLVSIPPEFPRPLGIGVFGHWSHALSEYSIQVFLDTSGPLASAGAASAAHRDRDRTTQGSNAITDGEGSRARDTPPHHSSQAGADDKPRFVRLLNILDMIFEMFVL